jgi:hypothetical protein
MDLLFLVRFVVRALSFAYGMSLAFNRLWLLFSCCLFSSRLPGGGITFFAAAKKVIKESSFSTTPKACRK